jgi:DNA (cytosine-5)-methyltransferase 1
MTGDRIKVLEGFAGPGGFSEGARMVGLTGMLGIDLNADACETAKAAGHRRFCGSIRDFEPADLPGVGVWLSAPPCPSFTVAGKGTGRAEYPTVLTALDQMTWSPGDPGAWLRTAESVTDPRTALVLETLRFAVDLPNVQTIVAEQVPAVEGIWMEMAAELATNFQFSYVNVVTVRASDLGAATRRERTFLIACRDDEPDFTGLPTRRRWSAGQTQEPRLEDPINPVTFPRTTMAQALGWPLGVRVNTRGARKTAGGNEFSADAPTPSMTGNGTRTWYRTDLGSVEGRLDAWQAGVLQGFPADYPWKGSRTSQFQRIADTVSPIVAAAVIGVACGLPWEDAVWRRLEALYGVGQLGLFEEAAA